MRTPRPSPKSLQCPATPSPVSHSNQSWHHASTNQMSRCSCGNSSKSSRATPTRTMWRTRRWEVRPASSTTWSWWIKGIDRSCLIWLGMRTVGVNQRARANRVAFKWSRTSWCANPPHHQYDLYLFWIIIEVFWITHVSGVTCFFLGTADKKNAKKGCVFY